MTSKGLVHIVEDDAAMRESLVAVLGDAGYDLRAYSQAEEFLAQCGGTLAACVVSDIRLPGMDGLALLRRARAEGIALPLVLITGHADVALAVAAMKAGAVDFLEKPFTPESLLLAVEHGLQAQHCRTAEWNIKHTAAERLKALTPRERDVLECLVAGKSNKEAAVKLGLSPRTIEFHRAHIMEKTGAQRITDLVRLWMAAQSSG